MIIYNNGLKLMRNRKSEHPQKRLVNVFDLYIHVEPAKTKCVEYNLFFYQ